MMQKENQAPHAGPRKTNDSKLARLRMERGLTQQQLADMIGCQCRTIVRWESGQSKPSMMAIKNVTAALGCAIEDLI